MVLDIDTLALSNAYIETEGVGERETVALINIGARFTNLAITHGPRRVFVRDIASGGDMLSRAVSEIYGLDLPLAEKRKREAVYTPLEDLGGGGEEGFEATEGGTGGTESGNEEYVLLDGDETSMGLTSGGAAGQSGGSGETLTGDEDFEASGQTQNAMGAAQKVSANRAVLADALGDLVSEIQDTFKYYINRRIIPRVDKVKLCGGTAKFPDIDEFSPASLAFRHRCGIPLLAWMYPVFPRNSRRIFSTKWARPWRWPWALRCALSKAQRVLRGRRCLN